jgi:hypothetical protein
MAKFALNPPCGHTRVRRLEAQVTMEQKAPVRHADIHKGWMIADFAPKSVQDVVRHVIEWHRKFEQSAYKSQPFADVLLNSRDINARLLDTGALSRSNRRIADAERSNEISPSRAAQFAPWSRGIHQWRSTA